MSTARCERTRKNPGRVAVSLGKCPDAGAANCAIATSYSRWTDHSIHLCSKTVRATFMAHGSSVMHPLSLGIPPLLHTAVGTCDLTVHASPLRDIAPSRRSAGSSAYAALLRPITCTSPSARQPIRGVTPGLRFLRDPSRHAMRLAPAHDNA
jgi:hypothetical protein